MTSIIVLTQTFGTACPDALLANCCPLTGWPRERKRHVTAGSAARVCLARAQVVYDDRFVTSLLQSPAQSEAAQPASPTHEKQDTGCANSHEYLLNMRAEHSLRPGAVSHPLPHRIAQAAKFYSKA